MSGKDGNTEWGVLRLLQKWRSGAAGAGEGTKIPDRPQFPEKARIVYDGDGLRPTGPPEFAARQPNVLPDADAFRRVNISDPFEGKPVNDGDDYDL